MPKSTIIEVKDAAHWVNIEKPELVNNSIIEYLKN